MKKQSGITLIALVISIIVMLILAGISINATVGENGVVSKAQRSSIMSKFSRYKEELELNAVEEMEIYASDDTLTTYIPSMTEEDKEKFVIMKRELLYIAENELEIEAAQNCGIGTAQAADETTSNSINEVKAVISGVINLSSKAGSSFVVPEDDFVETTNTNDSSKGLIGTRLYDKNSINSETWNIVIEYNSANQEVARYGSGYYWLKAGETYVIDGKSMKFENDFVVDYANKTYIALSGRAENWNVDATLAVSEGLVLNIDPMSLADGEWRKNATDSNFYDFYVKDNKTGHEENKEIQKTGDVVYDSTTRALKFNEDSANNPAGEGGYLKLLKTGVDFTNGFTFEMYMNLSRGRYPKEGGGTSLGLFCREPYMGYQRAYEMRFGMASSYQIGKFSDSGPIEDAPGDLIQSDSWALKDGSSADFTLNKDVYLTAVFTAYTEENMDILDDYQNKGYGKALVVFWENNMKLLGYNMLLTSTQDNETAKYFYEKLGYKVVGEFMLPKDSLELIYCKELD